MPIFKNLSCYKFIICVVMIVSGKSVFAQGAFEVNKVMAFFQNQQYDEVITYLASYEKKDTANLQLLGYIAYASQMSDNRSEASRYYSRMLAIDSNNISALQYISDDDDTGLSKAFLLTRRLVGLQPRKPSYHKNLAALYRKTNQKDSALIHYRQSYELAPADHRYVASYAEILIDQEQMAKADSLLDTGLMRDSLNISYLVLRIKSAYLSKDYQHVLVPGERLIGTGEKVLNPLLNLALAYYNLKLYPDCIRVCDYLLSQGFEIESVFFYQAKAWAKMNQYEKSNELLNTCLTIAISKTAEMYYYNLAENNEATKQFKKAVTYYDSAFYLFKNPNMAYNSGRVLEGELRNARLAEKYYARYLTKAKPVTTDDKKIYEYVKGRMKKEKSETTK